MKENIENYYNKCLEYIDKIKNPMLKDCCFTIYKEHKEKLMNKPATIGGHHFYKGGLLCHLYGVTRNAIVICNFYPELEVDIDLIVFGALLHDIGKINELNDFSDNNKIGKKGNASALLGHSYEGTHIVENYLQKYDLNDDFKNQALHMIGSHMNEFSEWGGLVTPKMLETIIINFADKIDSYLEPAHTPLKNAPLKETYQLYWSSFPYYKSLNPFYNTKRDI